MQVESKGIDIGFVSVYEKTQVVKFDEEDFRECSCVPPIKGNMRPDLNEYDHFDQYHDDK